MLLVVPPVILLTVASSQQGFTDHFWYVLPVLPFAFVWISRVAGIAASRPRTLGVAVMAALAWSVASSLSIYPHSLSYFNELVWGPRGGHFHLLSSNSDYGQDLLFLKEWLANTRKLGRLDSRSGTWGRLIRLWRASNARSRPRGSVRHSASSRIVDEVWTAAGWFAVNVNVLHGDDWPGRASDPTAGYYGYFLNCTAADRADYSIYIYHISADDAEHLWHRPKSEP